MRKPRGFEGMVTMVITAWDAGRHSTKNDLISDQLIFKSSQLCSPGRPALRCKTSPGSRPPTMLPQEDENWSF